MAAGNARDEPGQLPRRVEAAQRLQSRRRLRCYRVAVDSGRVHSLPDLRSAGLGHEGVCDGHSCWFPDRSCYCLGLRDDTGRNEADGECFAD